MFLSQIRLKCASRVAYMFTSQMKGSSMAGPIKNISLMLNLKSNLSNFSPNCSFSNFNRFSTMKFFLPDLGQKIKQGTVKTLYIKEGQKVQQFQKLSDVQSDKQFTQITSPTTGVIKKIHYQQSQVCKVGDLFLQIEVEGQSSFQKQQTNQAKKVQHDRQKLVKSQNKPKESFSTVNHSYGDQILTSPTVIMIAKQNKVDLRALKGSGKRGRITKQDLILYMEDQNKKSIPKNQKNISIVEKSSIFNEPFKAQNQKVDRKILSSGYGQQTVVSMKPAQVYNCKMMNASNYVPHLYFEQQFDVSESQKMRQAIKKQYEKSGFKVSLTSIILKTLSMTLRKHPKINSLYEPKLGQFQFHVQSEHNISFALDTVRHGLLYPTLPNVDKMNILEISQQLSRIKDLAESQSLEVLEKNGYFNQGSICISNVGTIGGRSANSLLIPHQVCIIAFGRAVHQVKMPVIGQNYSKKLVMNVTIGCDHRVLDGAAVARFCIQWKKYIENPYLLMQQLI